MSGFGRLFVGESIAVIVRHPNALQFYGYEYAIQYMAIPARMCNRNITVFLKVMIKVQKDKAFPNFATRFGSKLNIVVIKANMITRGGRW